MADLKKQTEKFIAGQAERDAKNGAQFMGTALGMAAEALIDAGQDITFASLTAWMDEQKNPLYSGAADEARRRNAAARRH